MKKIILVCIILISICKNTKWQNIKFFLNFNTYLVSNEFTLENELRNNQLDFRFYSSTKLFKEYTYIIHTDKVFRLEKINLDKFEENKVYKIDSFFETKDNLAELKKWHNLKEFASILESWAKVQKITFIPEFNKIENFEIITILNSYFDQNQLCDLKNNLDKLIRNAKGQSYLFFQPNFNTFMLINMNDKVEIYRISGMPNNISPILL